MAWHACRDFFSPASSPSLRSLLTMALSELQPERELNVALAARHGVGHLPEVAVLTVSVRRAILRRISEIEALGPELQLPTLGDRKIFEN